MKPIKLKKDGTPDLRGENGGHTNGGRKTKAEEMGLTEVLNEAMPFDELMRLIAEAARSGNWNAQKELLDRYAGKVADKSIVKQETTHKTGEAFDIKEFAKNFYKDGDSGTDTTDISTPTTE